LIVFDNQHLEAYRQNDALLRELQQAELGKDGLFTTHRWLLESLPKRMITAAIYGDLLATAAPRRTVLDVGGGYSSLTRSFLNRHDYFLLDIMAHDDHTVLYDLQRSLGRDFWIHADWHNFEPTEPLDLVIANDLFPNVDQRLAPFLEKYLPRCHEMRMSLTYYNTPRWYQVKRTDADEILHMMAWDGAQLRRVLTPFSARIADPQWDLLLHDAPSLFPNGRHVALLTIRGGQAR